MLVAGDPDLGAIKAIVLEMGEIRWEHKLPSAPSAGVLSTGGDLVFSGSREGYFFALDVYTGEKIWRVNLGGPINAVPITYLSGGKQMVSIAAGNALYSFGLEE